ncbi:MAG: HAD-IIIA family hydrolase [bacterium]
MKQLVILAGGLGTRLAERLNGLPKPLIDICGVSLLERQIQLAKHYGFINILLLINYGADQIIKFCCDHNNWGLNIIFIDDGFTFRGTAGAVLHAWNYLEEEFLVMYGDTMLNVDLKRFCNYHELYPLAAATLFLHPNDHPKDSDLVDMNEDGYISCFYSYPHDGSKFYANLVNAALYCVRKHALLQWCGCETKTLDFGKHLFPDMLNRGFILRGYRSSEYIKDCGTPARLDKVCVDFELGKIEKSSLKYPQMAVFVDRDGTINREVGYVKSVDQFELIPNTEEAIRKLNCSKYMVFVVTNQPVISRGECTFLGLREVHKKMETLLGNRCAYIDHIYYCPHYPDKGFIGEIGHLKIDCECRKPKTGMIDTAVEKFNLICNKSWMVGDTTSDILAANRAGLKSILVETGYAGLDYKYLVTPDFIVPDLNAAVTLILDIYPKLIELVSQLVFKIKPGDLVFIGGQSRSGKSSFASALKHVLAEKGIHVKILSTDRWLLNESEQGNGVLARHSLKELEDIVFSVAFPEKRPTGLSLPLYYRLTKAQIRDVEVMKLCSNDVIVFEGSVALALKDAAFCAEHRFFVEINKDEQKKRMLREYLLLGLTMQQSEVAYQHRIEEEISFNAGISLDATRVIIPQI